MSEYIQYVDVAIPLLLWERVATQATAKRAPTMDVIAAYLEEGLARDQYRPQPPDLATQVAGLRHRVEAIERERGGL